MAYLLDCPLGCVKDIVHLGLQTLKVRTRCNNQMPIASAMPYLQTVAAQIFSYSKGLPGCR